MGKKSQGKGSNPRRNQGADYSGRSKAAPRGPAAAKAPEPPRPPAPEATRQPPEPVGPPSEPVRSPPPDAPPQAPGEAPARPVASPALRAPQPAPRAPAPAPRPRPSVRTACYVDFENLFYNVTKDHKRTFNVAGAVRALNRLSRAACGEGFAHTAVYANWDSISAHARYAQNDWAQVGWRPVAVPSREDQVSNRVVKNLVDFVMSLDMLEDARDREYDHFFVVSGDADFCEVVERLKRLRRRVTVVCLRSALSYRLSQAADQVVEWEPEDISGKDAFPLASPRKMPRVPSGLQARPQADEWENLKLAWRIAQDEFGTSKVDWETVRDDYYLPLARCGPEEADDLLQLLVQGGRVIVKPYRARDGSQRHQFRLLA